VEVLRLTDCVIGPGSISACWILKFVFQAINCPLESSNSIVKNPVVFTRGYWLI